MADATKKLLFVVGAQTKDFNRALGDMERGATRTFGNINKALGGLLPALSIGAVVVGLADMTKNAAALGEELLLSSQKTGLTTDTLQDLNYLAKTTNSSLGGLEAGVKKMNNVLADAMGGNQSAIKSFENLGLSISDITAMNQDERFKAIAKAIAKIEDPALKSAAAVDFFGDSGVDLIPLIDALGKMKMSPPKFTPEELQSLADAKGKIEDLDYAWTITQGKFVSAMLPNLTPLLSDLNNLIGLLSGVLSAFNGLPPQLRVLLGGGGSPLNAALMMLGYPSGTSVKWAGAKAEGGIVTQPSLAMVGEAGPEAIVPLSRGIGSNITVNLSAGAFMGNESDARRFANMVIGYIRENNRLGTTGRLA